MTKDEIQQRAVEYSLSYPNLLVEWPTGCGKGKAAMECILASKSDKKWLILVPEIPQKDNWVKDAQKWGLFDQISHKIEAIECYASFKNYEGRALNLALNEVHRLSEYRGIVLDSINYDQIIADSATVPTEVRKRLPSDLYTYKITMDEAISNNILPKPDITVHYIDLAPWPKNYTKKLNIKKKKVLIKCSALEYYKHLTKQYNYWKNRFFEQGEEWAERKMFTAALDRKRFLAQYKTEKAKEVLSEAIDKRKIVFCGSVEQAKELGGENAVYGENKDNLTLIEQFNNLEINELYACMMLKEGMNLNQIEWGLVIQLDSKDTGNIQRLGRILRSLYPEFHLICVKNTKDEKYLENFLKNLKYDGKTENGPE